MRVLLFLTLACNLSATTYYVDIGTGNNANAGTSTGAAWKYLPGTVGQTGAGWVVLQHGDTVYVKGGTTNFCQVQFGSGNYNGNAAYNSILIQSGHLAGSPWGTGRAIFDQNTTNTYGFWIAGGNACDGLTIDGFEVRNIQSGGVGLGFDPSDGSCCIAVGGAFMFRDVSIKRCYLHDSQRLADDRGHAIETDGSAGGPGGSSNLLVYYNYIGPNIGTKGTEMVAFNYGAISNNFYTDSQDHGIVISGNNFDVCNNMIFMTPGYVHEPVFGLKLNGNYNDVWNNVIFADRITPGGATNNWQGLGTLNHASHNRFAHNTVVNAADLNPAQNRNAGFSFADESGEGTNNQVINSIFAFCTNALTSWINMQVYLNAAAVGCSVSYCDLWSSAITDKVIVFSAGPVFYDAVEAMAASPIGSGNTIALLQQSNPMFSGGSFPSGLDSSFHPNSDYFKLTESSSPAVSITGHSLSGTSTNGYSSASDKFNLDILGNARSQWSMGAYEFTSTNIVSHRPIARAAGFSRRR